MMRTQTALGLIAAFAFTGSVFATNYVFDKSSGNWHDEEDWYPVGTPGSGDTATILNGQTCTLDQSDVYIGDVTVLSGGTLVIKDKALQFGDSTTLTVNGLLSLDTVTSDTTTLKFRGQCVLAGSGTINASRGGSGGYTATLKNVVTADDDTIAIANALTIKGSVDVNGLYVNNQGTFLVDHASDVMGLGAADVIFPTGTGKLRVTAGQAVLNLFEADTTGPSDTDWTLELTGGEIEIATGADVTSTDIKLNISGGTFDLNDSMVGKAFTFSGGIIDVAANKTLLFTGP